MNPRQAAPPPSPAGTSIAIAFFVALLIGAIWIFALEIVHGDREETISAAMDRNDNLAIAFEEYTTRIIEDADDIISYMIRDYHRSAGKFDINRFAADYAIDNKAITDVVLVDENGYIATTAFQGKPAKPVNVADREHFKVHLAQDSGKLFIGKPFIGRVSGKSVIPVTRRINKPDGSFGGVAIVTIEHSRFTDVLQDAKMRKLDIISLVGFDGITRARLRGTTPTTGEDISKGPLFAELLRNPVGNYASPGAVDGVKRIFSYRSLPEYGLFAIVGAAELDVLAAHYRRQQQYFWTAGVASFWIAGFALLLILSLQKQHRTSASVARSQARFLATFNQAAVGIAHSDLDGVCLDANQKLCDIIGYRREELLGRKFTALTHPDDVAASDDFRRQMLARPDGFTSLQREKRYIHKNGSIVWCLLTTTVVRDDAGNIDYLAAIIQDISALKATEQSLRVLEQEQRLLAQQTEVERARLAEAQALARIGSWETRLPELTVAWSAETYRIFEVDADRFQPTHAAFLEFIHDDDRAKVDAAFSSSLEDQSRHSIEHRIVLRDGRIKTVEERWRTFHDDQGQPVRVAGTCQDITDKKKAEQDHAQLAAIVESSNDAIISRSLDGVIVSWNQAAERMFGWTAAEAIGRPPQIMTPPDYLGKFTTVIERVKRGEITAPFETVRVRKNSVRFDAQVCLSAVKDNSGQVIGIATIVRDISERKRAEAALRDYAAEMRHLSWRLSEVEERERRNIHRELHDQVGANLAALKLDLGLINTMLAAGTPKTISDRLKKTQQLTGETITRIRDVMADLRPPALDDYGLLAALRNYAQPYAARLGIPVMVDGDDIQPRLAIAIETALFRIAQEALSNIAKHAQARHVGITVTATRDGVTLVITDDGTGFDAGRVDPHHAAWGLRTMRERAQAIAAVFRVESSPGNGTRVIVELPRERT